MGLVRGLALAEMHTLHQQIAGSNFMIAFGSPSGMLLDIVSDKSFDDTADAAGIQPGCLWTESHCGTNGLGTATFTKRPIVVQGGEHFFSRYRALTCTASPVFGPDGALVGVLDASSDCLSRQTHTQALVAMAATQIENGLFRERHRADILIAFHNRGEYLHTLSAGLLAVDPEGRVLAANRAATVLLHGLPTTPGRSFSDIFRSRFAAFVDEGRSQERQSLQDEVGSELHRHDREPARTRRVGRQDEARPAAGGAASGRTRPELRFGRPDGGGRGPSGRDRGGAQDAGADPRRNGDRQGAAGPSRPSREPPDRRLRAGQLRGAARDADRGRTLRLCRRRLHGGSQGRVGRPVQGGRRGHAVPRRDRRHAGDAAGGPAALPRRLDGAPDRGREAGRRRAAGLGHQRQPRRLDREGPLPVRPPVQAQHARSDAAAVARAERFPHRGASPPRHHRSRAQPQRRRPGPPRGARMARQHPRTAQCAVAPDADVRRRPDRPGRPGGDRGVQVARARDCPGRCTTCSAPASSRPSARPATT